MLVELGKMEQRYDVVLGVIGSGFSMTEVSAAFGVSRQTVHEWPRRYGSLLASASAP